MAENLGIQDFEKRAQDRMSAIPAEREKKEQQLKQATETGMADIRGMQQMYGEAVGGIQDKYAGGVKESGEYASRSAQDVAFAPTKENIPELTQMFGMLTAVAMMAGGKGRQSGMGALAAMTGAMEGYQKGRKDVFNNELKEFDKRIREVQLHNQNVRNKLNDALKTLQTDRDSGLAKLKGLEMEIQGSQAALNFRRGDISNGIKNLNTELNSANQTISKYYERVQKAKDAEARNKAIVEAARLRAMAAGMGKGEKENGGTGKPLPLTENSKIVAQDSLTNSLEKLAKDFKPEYASLGVYSFGADLELEARRRFGSKDAQGAISWWSRYQRLQAPNRHALFGATLTGNELRNYQQFTAKPSDNADTVDTFLKDQIDYLKGLSSDKKLLYQASGYKVSSGKPVNFEQTYEKNLSPQDKEALNWAMANPDDPRAAKIKAKIGVQ